MDIKELYDVEQKFLGKEIEICGWIRKHRKQKELGFIDLSDGTCLKKLQVVYDKKTEAFEEIQKIHFGSSIKVIGSIVKSEIDGKIELRAKEIVLIGDCPDDYPIQPKKHTREFLREQAHLRARTTLFTAVFRVRSIAAMAVHQYFTSHGFLYLHAPILTGSDCEGAGEMFQVTTQCLDKIAETGAVDYAKDFFKKKVGLSVSAQLEAETYAQAFKKVYTFGPTFRADPSNTPYHVAEFWQIEPEVAFCDLDGIMDIAEDMLKFVIGYVLEHASDEMKFLDEIAEEDLIGKLTKAMKSEFKRVTYKECIEILKKSQRAWEYTPEQGADIAKEHEKYLTEYFGCPLFITMWPKELKSFYMKQMDDGTVAGADLELPGIGETFGMSQREDDYEKLITRMKELGMKLEEYDWYLELRKYGTCKRSGFGIGFERLVMYLTGMKNIRDVIAYPRSDGSCKF